MFIRMRWLFILIVIIVIGGVIYLGITSYLGINVHRMPIDVDPSEEIDQPSTLALDPSQGSEIGFIYEAFLSPHQEGGEEEDTPDFIPDTFKSTGSSVKRNDRPSHGHAYIEFTNDLSKAYVYLAIDDVKLDELNMLHIHCGRPGQLGPIIVDFSLVGDIHKFLADGVMAVEITNEHIVATASHGEGIVSAFTLGCPIIAALPADKVKTIAGMEYIGRQGDLYFNLHTSTQTYFGDMRGQFHLLTEIPSEE